MNLERLTPNTWVTRDHTRLRIQDMQTDHLTNTVAFLLRWGKATKRNDELRLCIHVGSVSYLGDYDVLDAEVFHLMEETAEEYCTRRIPCFGNMVRELIRRKEAASVDPMLAGLTLGKVDFFLTA